MIQIMAYRKPINETSLMQIQNNTINLNDYQSLSSEKIIQHLLEKYHQKLKRDLMELAPLFKKVAEVHGGKHPELTQSSEQFGRLIQNLEFHLAKEENVLFPLMIEYEKGKAIMPKEAFSTPVKILKDEHTNDIQFIAQLENLTKNYSIPSDACQSFEILYKRLSELSQDIREHMSIENEVLFPRFQSENSSCCGGGSTCGC